MKTVIVVLCLLMSTAAGAATWLVTRDGAGDFATIQAALDAAAPGDIIELADGTFTGPGNRDLDYQGKDLVVRSQSGDAEACIIDCQANVDDQHRGVWFQGGETAAARLENLTIVGGYVESGSPLPDGIGGAIMIMGDSAPTLAGLILRENMAMSGGALAIWEASPTIVDCRFLDNSGWWGAGGAISMYYAELTEPITGCLMRGNESHQAGGGVSMISCVARFEHCVFQDNGLSHGYGGGLEIYNESVVAAYACTFVGNQAENGGGIASWYDSELQLQKCTVADNEATSSGGGVFVERAHANITQTVIAYNSGEAVRVIMDGTVAIDCTDIYGNSGGDWSGDIEGLGDQMFNISMDPLFCGDSNPDQPYTVQPDSPCVPGQYPCVQLGAWGVGCTVTAAQPPAVGQVLTLHGAAPSPFNPRTSVTFSLREPARVELAVYDTRGRRVAVLADEVFAAGLAGVEWNGRDDAGREVPSGTYLITARGGGEVATRKAVLVR